MTHTPRIGGHATAGAHPSFSFLAFLPRGARYALWTLTQEPPLGGGKLYRYAFIPEKKHRRATAMSADFAEDSDGFIVFQCLCFTRQRPNKTVQSMKVEHHIFGSMSFFLSCCLSLSRSLPLSLDLDLSLSTIIFSKTSPSFRIGKPSPSGRTERWKYSRGAP